MIKGVLVCVIKILVVVFMFFVLEVFKYFCNVLLMRLINKGMIFK